MSPARAAEVEGSKSKMEVENFEPVGVKGQADSSVEEGLPGRCIWGKEKFDGGLGHQVPLGGHQGLGLDVHQDL